MNETFEYSLFNNWHQLYAKDVGAVSKKCDSNGREDSRSLLITSVSDNNWSNSYRRFIEVEQGDSFSVECDSLLKGDDISASVNIALFGANKRPVSWNFFRKKFKALGTWDKSVGEFVIPQGVKYIQLRLTGKGKGSYRFDNLVLAKTT